MASPELCNFAKYSPKISKHMANGRKLYELFNSLPNINKIYGRIEANKSTNEFAQECMTTLCERVLDGKPWDPSFALERGDYVRIEKELRNLNKDLGKGTSLSSFATTTFTPRAIADRYPNMRKFLNTFDEISSYEKNKYNKVSDSRSKVATGLKAAFIAKNMNVKDVLSKLNKNEKLLFESFMNGETSDQKMMGYIKDMANAVGRDGGEVLSDYFKVMENNVEINPGKLIGTFIRHQDGSLRAVDDNILYAAKHSRNLLNVTGEVLIKGLRKSLELADQISSNSARNNRRIRVGHEAAEFKRLKEEINKSIDDIEMSMKKGDYFPHYVLADILNVRKDLEKSIYQNGKGDDLTFKGISDHLLSIRQSLSDKGNLNRAKGRSDAVNLLWERNPLAALDRYSSDVVSFNKLVHMQSEYFKAIGDLESVDFNTARAMREFLGHTFDTATKGYTERPAWVNKVTRAISAYEFISKLGWGISTALRNTLSGAYYLAHMGGKYTHYSNEFKTSKYKNEIVKLEEEMGFKFLDARQTADEFAAEGLLPSKGIRKDSLYFDTNSNEWKYEDNEGVLKTVINVADKVIGSSAGLQRITENALRKRMFRASFMRALDIYQSQDSYVKALEAKSKSDDPEKRAEFARKAIYRKAAQTALGSVNKFAFAYDVFNKSVSIGGTHKTSGAIGQVMGIFMHYPMAFANLQVRAFKDAYAAINSGQGISNTDVQLAMGFMGIYLTTTLMSGLVGADMNFWINNDTADRIWDIADYLTEEDRDKRDKITYGAGPAGLVSGPFIGDARKIANGLLHTAAALDLIGRPDSELANMLTGYDKYADLSDDDKAKYFLRMINNQGFKLFNNTIPAFQSNNPMKAVASEFKIYNTEGTQKIRERLNKAGEFVTGKRILQEKPLTSAEKASRDLNILFGR